MVVHVLMHVSLYWLAAGDYDALLVLMLLPRLVFKAELVVDQLKQQVHECTVLQPVGYMAG